MHALAPVALLKEPAGHGEQDDCAANDANEPAIHQVHALAPANEYEPRAQLLHEEERTCELKKPAAQKEHAEAPL